MHVLQFPSLQGLYRSPAVQIHQIAATWAYDTVQRWHGLLWAGLECIGVASKLLAAIKSLYAGRILFMKEGLSGAFLGPAEALNWVVVK